MPNDLEHQSITLQTAEDMIETPQTPIILAGGPSSSELLNDLKENFIHDIILVDQRSRDMQSQISMALSIFQNQIDSIQAVLISTTARLPFVADSFLADFWTNDFFHPSNTAEINTTYGQATLPILSSQEKLVGRDTKGSVWIPKGAQASYAYTASLPNETQWLPDSNGNFALDQRSDTAWWRTRESSGSVFVRVKVPSNLNANRLANCIILHSYPTLYFDLISVQYRNPGGVLSTADLTYQVGWNTSLNKIQNVGNLRIWIPQTQVTEIVIQLTTPNIWGFSRISLQQVEFSPTATCVVDFTNYTPGTLSGVLPHGKDQSSLSFLSTAVAGNLVSVFLTQSSANTSPILTTIEVTNT